MAMVVGSGLWAASADRPPEPTWLVQRFCDSSFFRPYSPDGVPATNVVRGARLKLLLWQLTMDKGTTRRGYAFVAHTTFAAPTDGRYVFRLAPCADNCCAARLCVGGVFPDEQPDGGIELKAGAVPLAALVREKRAKDVDPKARKCASFDLLVKAPGATDFTPAEISYPVDASVMSGEYNRFEREFRAEEGVKRYFCYRTFPIDVPEDGWYEFGVREERASGNIRLCLDDLQVLAVQPRAIDFNDDYFGEPTFDGNRRSFRFDFIPRMTRVRKLTKGRHLLDVYVYPGPWQFDDGAVESRMTNGALRVGYTRLTGRNPRSETGFWLEGRDDMVFEKGETLRLSAGSASPVAREHVFEVTNRYVGGAAFVQRLPVDTTVKTFTYDCAQEGAFEYRVLDAQGRVVDGPWAFVVADPTPRPRVKGTGVVPPAANEVVDEVVCTEGAGGPHLFREGGGASEVVTNAAGLVYRQAGPLGLRVKRVVRLGKLGSKDFRDKNYRLATEDEIKTRQSRGFLQMDWFAYTLKVRHPGWPHVVRCTVPNDRSRLVTCAAFDRKTGAYNAFNLQAGCGPACAPTSHLSFFVWPNTDAIDVMIPNTDGNHASKFDRRGAVVKIELLECPDGHIPELPEAAGGWTEARGFGWQGEQGDLYVHERTMPPLWADETDWLRPEMDNHAYHSWRDFLVSWDRFGELSAYRGDSLCAGPVFSYGMQVYQGPVSRICYPGRDIHGTAHHNEFVDPFDRDQFKLLLMKASRHNVRYVADFMLYVPAQEGAFWAMTVGLPAETNSIFLSADASGKPWKSWTGALVNNPAHPVYRKMAVRFCEELGRRYGKYPAFAGIRSRYWYGCEAGFEPWWRSWDLGFDDWTVAQFAKEKGLDLKPVGTDQSAFLARRADITNRYGKVWSAWRAQKVFTLREEMLAALRKYAPQAELFVSVAKSWRPDAGLDPELFRGRRDLGYLPEQSGTGIPGENVEVNNLDGRTFENFDVRPERFRPIDHGTNEFGCGSYPQGLCCNSGYKAHPYQLERPARALANNALKMFRAGGEWCLPPADEGLRAFVQVYRAIPDLDYTVFAASHGTGTNAPYAAYTAQTKDGLVAWFANATDCSLVLTAGFDARSARAVNLTDGTSKLFTKELKVELAPFMPAVWRLPGANRLVSLKAEVVGEGRERIERAWRQIAAFKPLVEQSGAREVRTSVGYDAKWKPGSDVTFGGPDTIYEWKDLVAPLDRAAADGDWLQVDLLRKRLFAEHPWWFKLFGWPEDEPYCTAGGGLPFGFMKNNRHCPRIGADLDAGEFVLFPEYDTAPQKTRPRPAAFVTAQGKSAELHFGGTWCGMKRVVVTALFGGDYGPISVIADGRKIWTFPASPSKEVRWETRITPSAYPWTGAGSSVRIVGEGEKGAAVLDAGIVGEAPQPVTRFLTAEGKVFDIGKRRAFDVEEAGTDALSFWVENPGKSSFTTAFVVGSEACALIRDGKKPATVVRQAEKPCPWYVGVPLHCPDKLTRFDLKLDRTKKGSKVGVAVFNSTGLVFHAHE